jgi:aromatic ring hydroxylase
VAEWLRIAANFASILTSIIAVAASVVYWMNKRSRRVRLESYLKAKKEKSPTEAFSVTRLMADLGMTEAEIFAASFASRHIVRGVRRDRTTGFAAEVLFQYRETAESAQPDLVVYQADLRDLDESSE